VTPYLDAGFLLTLLVPTDGTALANQLLRRATAPFALNFLHQLQAENLLKRMETSLESQRKTAGFKGRQLWEQYLAEGVFHFKSTDWDIAFHAAIAWNDNCQSTPPLPLLLLHPALAVVAGAADFLSFEPRSRAAAKSVGLRVLPEQL